MARLERPFQPALLAFFLELGPLLVFFLSLLEGRHAAWLWGEAPLWHASIGLAAFTGALFLPIFPSWGKSFISLSLLGFLIASLSKLYESPSGGLLVISFCSLCFFLLQQIGVGLSQNRRQQAVNSWFFQELTFYTSFYGGLLWLLGMGHNPKELGLDKLFAILSLLLVLSLFSVETLLYHRRHWQRWLALSSLLLLLPTISLVQARGPQDLASHSWLAIVCCLYFSKPFHAQLKKGKRLVEVVFTHPEGSIVITFAVFSLLGALLLYLPQSSARHPLSLIDSAFTAISAVCVTGLVVVDTGTAFSDFGKGVLLALIQLGGLGIMSVSSLTVMILRQRLSLQQEKALSGAIGQKLRGEVFFALQRVLKVTFLIELSGACLLALLFHFEAHLSWQEAIQQGVFTSISAFCNAGFALYADSLIPFQRSGLMLHTIALLIILGGISPAFVAAMPQLFRYRHRLPLQHRFVILANLALLFLGTLAIATIEWKGALAGLSFSDKINNAWFQSVTLRTAGFNSLALSDLNAATLFFMMALMTIGGSPGGTAGGIKTTTFMVLCATVASTALGKNKVTAFYRQIPATTIYKAASIVALTIFIGFSTLIAILLTQTLEPVVAIFEVVSALNTVGLSLGGTAQLDYIGKIIIMACMFLGRVGSYSMLLYLAHRSKHVKWHLPKEEVIVT